MTNEIPAGLEYAHDNVCGADFSGADFRNATLSYADFRNANLRGADLTGATLGYTDFSGADLVGAKLPFDGIPVIPHIDAAIMNALDGIMSRLHMVHWHTCETTHCRGGWAITLAGDAGRELERRVGTATAAALIYAVSRPNMRVPDFYADTYTAFLDIESCAILDPLA